MPPEGVLLPADVAYAEQDPVFSAVRRRLAVLALDSDSGLDGVVPTRPYDAVSSSQFQAPRAHPALGDSESGGEQNQRGE